MPRHASGDTAAVADRSEDAAPSVPAASGLSWHAQPIEKVLLGDAERVIAACHTVASASGGAFGLRRISAPEQDVLDRITYALERKGIVSGRR